MLFSCYSISTIAHHRLLAQLEVAKQHDIQLEVVKLPEAKPCLALLRGQWVIERSFA
ncbi:MAG: hypothetical protein M3Z24_06675 [Chloroflexota bacterium]|nr:hypothetical protein [Chloroflexota bacterium]